MARVARPYQPARPGSHGLGRLPPPHTHPWVHQSAGLRVCTATMLAAVTRGSHGLQGLGLPVHGGILLYIPHAVHMGYVDCHPSQYMGLRITPCTKSILHSTTCSATSNTVPQTHISELCGSHRQRVYLNHISLGSHRVHV